MIWSVSFYKRNTIEKKIRAVSFYKRNAVKKNPHRMCCSPIVPPPLMLQAELLIPQAEPPFDPQQAMMNWFTQLPNVELFWGHVVRIMFHSERMNRVGRDGTRLITETFAEVAVTHFIRMGVDPGGVRMVLLMEPPSSPADQVDWMLRARVHVDGAIALLGAAIDRMRREAVM